MNYDPYTEKLKTAVFDIETAGLSSQKDMIISASFINEDGTELRQYFCDDPESEYLLLTRIFEEFSNLDAVITYNGESFDIPFVKKRAEKYSMMNSRPNRALRRKPRRFHPNCFRQNRQILQPKVQTPLLLEMTLLTIPSITIRTTISTKNRTTQV